MSIEIDDRAMLGGLKQVIADFHVEARAMTGERVRRVLGRMQQLVHRLSGETAASLGIREGSDYFDVGVVDNKHEDPNVPFYEEFGTSAMEPRPFGRPAVNEER